MLRSSRDAAGLVVKNSPALFRAVLTLSGFLPGYQIQQGQRRRQHRQNPVQVTSVPVLRPASQCEGYGFHFGVSNVFFQETESQKRDSAAFYKKDEKKRNLAFCIPEYLGPVWRIKNGSTDHTESQLSHLLIYGICIGLDTLPPGHLQPCSKNKGQRRNSKTLTFSGSRTGKNR